MFHYSRPKCYAVLHLSTNVLSYLLGKHEIKLHVDPNVDLN